MRFIIITFLIPLFFSCKAQNTTSSIQNLGTTYLNTMYRDKNFDDATKSWDNRMLLEMQDFYNKRGKGILGDSALLSNIKRDVSQLYKKTKNYNVIEFNKNDSTVSDGHTICTFLYKFSEEFDNVIKPSQSMIVFISEDHGKNWIIQDWRIKAICDRVYKGTL